MLLCHFFYVIDLFCAMRLLLFIVLMFFKMQTSHLTKVVHYCVLITLGCTDDSVNDHLKFQFRFTVQFHLETTVIARASPFSR